MLSLTSTETVELLAVEPGRLLVRVEWAAGHARPPMHYHPGHVERFEVLSGSVIMRVGDAPSRYGPGDAVEIPAGTPHTMWPDGGPAVATWECRPAGRVLAFFHELDALTAIESGAVRAHLSRAAVVGRYDDVLRIAVGPRRLVRVGLRVLAALLPTRTDEPPSPHRGH